MPHVLIAGNAQVQRFDRREDSSEARDWAEMSNYASPMLCNSSVIDYLNMRDEGGLVKGLVKVEIGSR